MTTKDMFRHGNEEEKGDGLHGKTGNEWAENKKVQTRVYREEGPSVRTTGSNPVLREHIGRILRCYCTYCSPTLIHIHILKN